MSQTTSIEVRADLSLKAIYVVRSMGTVCCTRNERSGLAWFRTGIWKLKEMRKGYEKEDAVYAERKKMLYMYY
jgi:hypothetical protein